MERGERGRERQGQDRGRDTKQEREGEYESQASLTGRPWRSLGH